jgi:hypothetical protein
MPGIDQERRKFPMHRRFGALFEHQALCFAPMRQPAASFLDGGEDAPPSLPNIRRQDERHAVQCGGAPIRGWIDDNDHAVARRACQTECPRFTSQRVAFDVEKETDVGKLRSASAGWLWLVAEQRLRLQSQALATIGQTIRQRCKNARFERHKLFYPMDAALTQRNPLPAAQSGKECNVARFVRSRIARRSPGAERAMVVVEPDRRGFSGCNDGSAPDLSSEQSKRRGLAFNECWSVPAGTEPEFAGQIDRFPLSLPHQPPPRIEQQSIPTCWAAVQYNCYRAVEPAPDVVAVRISRSGAPHSV